MLLYSSLCFMFYFFFHHQCIFSLSLKKIVQLSKIAFTCFVICEFQSVMDTHIHNVVKFLFDREDPTHISSILHICQEKNTRNKIEALEDKKKIEGMTTYELKGVDSRAQSHGLVGSKSHVRHVSKIKNKRTKILLFYFGIPLFSIE